MLVSAETYLCLGAGVSYVPLGSLWTSCTPIAHTLKGFNARNLYTKQPLHQKMFTPKAFYTKQFLHQKSCKPNSLYIRSLLHQKICKPNSICRSFYALHQKALAPENSHTGNLSHQTALQLSQLFYTRNL